ncbi:MAG TPA: helical backbone metal receptor, partial [Gemmatimonadaceae bacterium]
MRLVSLCPSLTELVFDLGRGAELVGRTRFCVHPEGLVDQVERVGGTKNPKIPRILELAPDLVLLNEEENRREDWEALEGAGIRCHVSFPRDVAGTAAMVRDIAAVLGRAAEGERIAADIEARAARVAAAAARRAPVRYAYLIWRDPWMAVSDDTFVSAMLGLAGGENVLAGAAERYPTVTAEALRDAAPDRVFLSSEPFPFTATHAAELAAATGLPVERFVLADGELLSWHGSRTARGVDYAGALLARA